MSDYKSHSITVKGLPQEKKESSTLKGLPQHKPCEKSFVMTNKPKTNFPVKGGTVKTVGS